MELNFSGTRGAVVHLGKLLVPNISQRYRFIFCFVQSHVSRSVGLDNPSADIGLKVRMEKGKLKVDVRPLLPSTHPHFTSSQQPLPSIRG